MESLSDLIFGDINTKGRFIAIEDIRKTEDGMFEMIVSADCIPEDADRISLSIFRVEPATLRLQVHHSLKKIKDGKATVIAGLDYYDSGKFI